MEQRDPQDSRYEQRGKGAAQGSSEDVPERERQRQRRYTQRHEQPVDQHDVAIGEVRQVQADLGVDRPYDPADRLFDPAQGGGAMLDLGVYVVSLAQHFLGTPSTVSVSGSLAPTGVEWEAGALLGYEDDGVYGAGRGALELPDNIVSSEFLTMEGRRFSVSRGVVIPVRDFLSRYDPDALRSAAEPIRRLAG